MAVKIDYLAQDCDTLLVAVNNHRSAMNAKGFSEEVYTGFLGAKENLRVTELAQQNAVKFAQAKTADQEFLISEITRIIKVIRSAVKSAYGEDAQRLKLFKVNDAIPKTVKGLRPICEYLSSLATLNSEELLKNGLGSTDITDLGTFLTNLIAADAVQENAKKLQVAATSVRDESGRRLKAKTKKIRNFADACFSKNPEILVEFKPLPRGRGGKGKGGGDTPPTEPPTPDS